MIVKVCGIRTEENIRALSKLPIDMVGLNFYPPSIRYVDDTIGSDLFEMLPDGMARVGVFVNMDIDDVMDKVDEYRLDYVQLHGDESLAYAKEIARQTGLIKVFRVSADFDITTTSQYDFAHYLLFDKDTNCYGGSGHKFDWRVLDLYDGEVPFLLAGGIGPRDAAELKQLAHPLLAGIDINSRFEQQPGIKDVAAVSRFLKELAS